MIDLVHSLIPEFSHFQELPIMASGTVIGYESVLKTKSDRPYAGGTSNNLNDARRICLAEAIERKFFYNLLNSNKKIKDLLLLKDFPTTCGFAAGFEEYPTIFRAVCEAIERWAWSKWIDSGFAMPNVDINKGSPLQEYYKSTFDEVHFFQTAIEWNNLGLSFMPGVLNFSVVIGVKGEGIFPGSRVTTLEDNPWEHALLEAWRHLRIFQYRMPEPEKRDLFDKRINYFGSNGIQTLSKLLQYGSNLNWPKPELKALVKASDSSKYFVWRALCDDYIGWNKGNCKRFVY